MRRTLFLLIFSLAGLGVNLEEVVEEGVRLCKPIDVSIGSDRDRWNCEANVDDVDRFEGGKSELLNPLAARKGNPEFGFFAFADDDRGCRPRAAV